MLQPINLPPETGGIASGQNNTCGRGGNELEGMQKMCIAEHGLWKWMGSLKKIALRCPLKHLPRRQMTLLQLILMLGLSGSTG